jgi:hypothetical protein
MFIKTKFKRYHKFGGAGVFCLLEIAYHVYHAMAREFSVLLLHVVQEYREGDGFISGAERILYIHRRELSY